MPTATSRRPADGREAGRRSTHELRPEGAKGKKKRKSKVRSPLWAKLLTIFGAITLVAGFGGVVMAKSYIGQLTDSIETGQVLDADSLKNDAPDAASALKGPIDLLLLGLDTREGWAPNTSRADTIIVLHIPASHDQAYLMSIPRDAYMDIPSYTKAGWHGGKDKANAAFFLGSQKNQGWKGGAALTASMVNKATGLKFNGVVVIDFNGFKRIIDALGTVYMCVDHETVSDHYIVENGKPVYAKGKPTGVFYKNSYKHKVGCRDMPGWEALDFSRQRKGGANGDYDRQRHQQQLIKAMAKKASSAGIISNPAKVGALISAAGSALKMDTGNVAVDDFIFALKSIAGADLLMLKSNGGTYNSADVNGMSAEMLSGNTLEMFEAAKNDQLGQFILAHPEFLNREK
ncbi:LCP family protein required for cell wall assembly [Allocatelliglobosispora scoriae]|uniref:LCP family protein required for cell wall assembly n=1 Tax=Allocatelliglobosispora scoriae TaxID=643052 RepID=A0A841C0D5_9ACTN|nr:LCP family protein [Allocatelliglobosispora scoriae]MBB5872613.1 LCP family protein required for cell wall assembly [Allocatelliglobosispora scoriae]